MEGVCSRVSRKSESKIRNRNSYLLSGVGDFYFLIRWGNFCKKAVNNSGSIWFSLVPVNGTANRTEPHKKSQFLKKLVFSIFDFFGSVSRFFAGWFGS